MAAASPLQPSQEQGRGCETKAKRAGGKRVGRGTTRQDLSDRVRGHRLHQEDHEVRRGMKSRAAHYHRNTWSPSAPACSPRSSGLFSQGTMTGLGGADIMGTIPRATMYQPPQCLLNPMRRVPASPPDPTSQMDKTPSPRTTGTGRIGGRRADPPSLLRTREQGPRPRLPALHLYTWLRNQASQMSHLTQGRMRAGEETIYKRQNQREQLEAEARKKPHRPTALPGKGPLCGQR